MMHWVGLQLWEQLAVVEVQQQVQQCLHCVGLQLAEEGQW
jgi:hypothetical protein